MSANERLLFIQWEPALQVTNNNCIVRAVYIACLIEHFMHHFSYNSQNIHAMNTAIVSNESVPKVC